MTGRYLAALAVAIVGLWAGAGLADQWWRVVNVAADDVLNMRAEPDPDTRIVGTIPPSADRVHSAGEDASYQGRRWLRVTYAGASGWVNTHFLSPTDAPDPSRLGGVETGDRVALVIGVSDYSGLAPPLRNPARDARLMSDRLTALGFDVTLLLDPDSERILSALDTMATRARAPEAALFYFSGHGLGLGGESHLVPRTAADADVETVVDALVPLSTVMAKLEALDADSSFVILDACRNAPELFDAAERARGFGAIDRDATRGLGRIVAGRDFLILYATDPNNVADDGAGENSPFTAALAARMGAPEVEIRETVRRVRGDVLASTSGAQSPWVEESLTKEFYFRPAPEVPMADFFGVYSFTDMHSFTCKVEVTRSGTTLRSRSPTRSREIVFDGSFFGCADGGPSVETALSGRAEIERLIDFRPGTDSEAFPSTTCGQSIERALEHFYDALGGASAPTLTTSCGLGATARHFLAGDQLLLALPQGDGQVDYLGVFQRVR